MSDATPTIETAGDEFLAGVCANLVDDIKDMLNLHKEYENSNDSFADYLQGCIETRVSVIHKLGYKNLLDDLDDNLWD